MRLNELSAWTKDKKWFFQFFFFFHSCFASIQTPIIRCTTNGNGLMFSIVDFNSGIGFILVIIAFLTIVLWLMHWHELQKYDCSSYCCIETVDAVHRLIFNGHLVSYSGSGLHSKETIHLSNTWRIRERSNSAIPVFVCNRISSKSSEFSTSCCPSKGHSLLHLIHCNPIEYLHKHN